MHFRPLAAEELEAQKEDDRVKLEEIYRLKKNLKGLDAITAEDFTHHRLRGFLIKTHEPLYDLVEAPADFPQHTGKDVQQFPLHV